MGGERWVVALPAASCAFLGGCRPPDPPLLPGGATAPQTARKAPPARAGGVFCGCPGGGGSAAGCPGDGSPLGRRRKPQEALLPM
eukprot:11903590-Alexandrium_andersonii.AAC.1